MQREKLEWARGQSACTRCNAETLLRQRGCARVSSIKHLQTFLPPPPPAAAQLSDGRVCQLASPAFQRLSCFSHGHCHPPCPMPSQSGLVAAALQGPENPPNSSPKPQRCCARPIVLRGRHSTEILHGALAAHARPVTASQNVSCLSRTLHARWPPINLAPILSVPLSCVP